MNSNEHNPMDHWPGENMFYSLTNDKFTLFTIVFLPTVGIILAFTYLYDRCSRSHHARNNRRRTMVLFATDPSVTPSHGLDPAVLKSLHVFTFSDVTHKDRIDCAVCLSEFEEGESGRVLPGCKHAFHVECIDMWFHSHSTCPLCRSLVEPPATMVEEEKVTIITIYPEPASSSGSGSSGIEIPRRSNSELQYDLTRDIVMTESDIERGREDIK